VVLLDLRSRWEFMNTHVPGAVHTDYARDGWRADAGQGKAKVKGLLPPIDKLEALIGGLGINNDTQVVLMTGGFGAGDMASATRVYWTFKVLGHDTVSILDGGFLAYTRNRSNPLIQGAYKPPAKTFKANLNLKILATRNQVRQALDGGNLVDNRSHDQFLGVNKSSSARRAGTLPGARNLPGAWLTRDGGGQFRDAKVLRKLYEVAGVPTDGAGIYFCNTGHWASLGWFVAHELLGNDKASLYDGSMADWTSNADAPVARAVAVD